MATLGIIDKLKSLLNEDDIETNADMRKNTTFKIGGPADILIKPRTVEEIKNTVALLNETKTPFFVMGNGSNLLVKDKGIRGAVIKIGKNFSDIQVYGNTISAQAGALLPSISNRAIQNNLSGFEFAAGIPGTLGGAIVMNAGAHGGEMKDIVTNVTLMDYEGNIKVLSNKDMNFEYRKSILANEQYIVLSVEMELKPGNAEETKSIIKELRDKRTASQPLEYPSAGSTFKRPLNNFAGKLVEDAGLKGFTIGGAKVSEKHAGFVINNGNATAKDVLDLIEYAKNEVNNKFNILLEEEIKVVGE